MARLLPSVVLVAASVAGLMLADQTPSEGAGERPLLVALRASADANAAAELAAVGAEVVDRRARLWRVRPAAGETVASLTERGAVLFAEPERTYASVSVSATAADPLSEAEWWRAQVGVEGLTPPGPGIPVTVVDSGLDFQHPEFAGRPDTEALNAQEPQPLGGEHGTMVSSLIGAPENGAGIVGIYPQAVIRSWDAAIGEGTRLDGGEIVSGILTAARSGRGVINLSLGGDRDLALEYAISEAVALGSLVVVASGNDGGNGNTLAYPAILPHVVTVGATDRAGRVASFSSTSPYVDIAAPGDGVTVASAIDHGWKVSSGTSFSTPLVSGAAAWVWTVRPELTADQLAEVLRRSARDLEPAGRDAASGFGMLNVAAALASPTPVPDGPEPDDDTDNVDPEADRNFAHPAPLTTKSRRRAAVTARVDRFEDPRDVYRVWLPRRARVTVVATASTDIDLALFRAGTPSVEGAFVGRFRLARAQTAGVTERLVFRNGPTGRWAYLVVSPRTSVTDATYRVVVASSG